MALFADAPEAQPKAREGTQARARRQTEGRSYVPRWSMPARGAARGARSGGCTYPGRWRAPTRVAPSALRLSCERSTGAVLPSDPVAQLRAMNKKNRVSTFHIFPSMFYANVGKSVKGHANEGKGGKD
jgi:hypothetical protein